MSKLKIELRKKKEAKRLDKKAAREKANEEAVKAAMHIPEDKKKRYDQAMTFIIILQEVIMIFVATLLDHPLLHHTVGGFLKRFVAAGEDLNENFCNKAREDKRYNDGEELMRDEASNLYELICATQHLKTEEQWLKAVSSIKAIK